MRKKINNIAVNTAFVSGACMLVTGVVALVGCIGYFVTR